MCIRDSLWLFRSIIHALRDENPELFRNALQDEYQRMIKEGTEQEMAWADYVIGNRLEGLNGQMCVDYIRYLGNLRATGLGDVYKRQVVVRSSSPPFPLAYSIVLKDAYSVDFLINH